MLFPDEPVADSGPTKFKTVNWRLWLLSLTIVLKGWVQNNPYQFNSANSISIRLIKSLRI